MYQTFQFRMLLEKPTTTTQGFPPLKKKARMRFKSFIHTENNPKSEGNKNCLQTERKRRKAIALVGGLSFRGECFFRAEAYVYDACLWEAEPSRSLRVQGQPSLTAELHNETLTQKLINNSLLQSPMKHCASAVSSSDDTQG